MTMSVKSEISNVAKDVELIITQEDIHEESYNMWKKKTRNTKGIIQ
jgi:hypothetical protein